VKGDFSAAVHIGRKVWRPSEGIEVRPNGRAGAEGELSKTETTTEKDALYFGQIKILRPIISTIVDADY